MTTKIKMEIPDWAMETHSVPTVRSIAKEIIKQLPIGHEFNVLMIHKQILKKKGYEDLNSRRTREAIQILRENGFIKEICWKNRVKHFARC
tara:strand:- start:543 stop:815 length:273 start_codon:yes stop_codon:yes gene_type:complete